MVETHFRSILKAVSWRVGGTMVTVTVAWLLTKSFDLAAQIGIFDTVVKIGVFYAHERFWNRLNFGKIKSPEYEI
jgi:adenylylsulfate kinase